MHLNTSVVVVTGGSSGLGLAVVTMALSQGAKVAIWDLQDSSIQELLSTVGRDRLLFFKVDVTSTPQIEAALQGTVQAFGQINALVNCAGVVVAGLIVDKHNNPHPLDSFQLIMRINVIGTFNVSRLVAKQMISQPGYDRKNDRGVIVNVSSVAGIEGQKGQSAYAASKAAINGLTLPMARDLGEFKIRVATIAPGIFMTPMGKGMPEKILNRLVSAAAVKRAGESPEFAHAVKYCIENEYFTGEIMRLDGGIRFPHF